MFSCRILLVAVLLSAAVCVARGEDQANRRAKEAFFEKKIRPVMVQHCYQCHSKSAKDVGGALYLDRADTITAGGESGPPIVAGDPNKSLLIKALRHDSIMMPPESKLDPAIVKDFEDWVSDGAYDPRDTAVSRPTPKMDKESMWSFFPIGTYALPEVSDRQWPRDASDYFVLEQIESRSLAPAGDADPRTLCRRLYYDLTGLPPTRQDVDRFALRYQTDPELATERLVDQLLASPAFGVHWGRFWLDVARYAESNGDDGLGRNATFPHAWRYRDYVIEAFNRDQPYDDFIVEQIAGDLLPADSYRQYNRQLIATGFLAIGAKPAKAMNNNFAMDIVDDQIDTVSTAVMGMSIACARCHDHKHDPIATSDYYGLAGIFSSTQTLYGLAANEALTAPATPLHELIDRWPPGRKADKHLTIDDEFAQAAEALGPVSYESFTQQPQSLSAIDGASFDPKEFGTLKKHRLVGAIANSPQNASADASASSSYSVDFWFRCDTPNNARPITAYVFSRAAIGDKKLPGDHIGIGGTHDKSKTGKLFVFNGNDAKQSVAGERVLKTGQWYHIALVRNGESVKLFLNGEIEVEATMAVTYGSSTAYSIGARSDFFSPLVGSIAHYSVFDKTLSDEEVGRLHDASGLPRATPQAVGLAMGVRESEKPADTKVHINGSVGKLGPIVQRGYPVAYRAGFSDQQWNQHTVNPGTSGRLELAQWLTDPVHPQSARVIVNRVWARVFGRGIVETLDDFGVYGARPSHRELLDSLAKRFVEHEWSIKRLVRNLVTSRTYQLASTAPKELFLADPDNQLFARYRRKRLQSEALRDSLLACSGLLDHGCGKGSVISKNDSLINFPPGEASNLHQESNHRSIYLCMLRNSPPPELAAFDFPNPARVVGQRDDTTLPTHGLYLFNSPVMLRAAAALAQLAARQPGSDAERVCWIIERVLAREPSDAEISESIDYIHSLSNSDDDRAQPLQWQSFCHAMLMLSEFRYID